MAQALKDNYGIDVVHKIAHMINRALPTFKCEAFIDYTQSGYEALELMERGRKISKGLKAFLPDDYQQAVTVILDAVEPPIELDENNSIATFLYMPFVNYVAENGLHDFDVSMHALYVLTQKFTSEFGIRPFIEKYPEQSLLLLFIVINFPHYIHLINVL